MRVLVVYCHPVPESFCAALRDAVLETLASAGHETRLIDLYEERFDPIMAADERRIYNELKSGQHPLPDHADHLKWAQGIVFIYPTWWYGLPAMLKGWLDRVWTPGVAFEMDLQSGKLKPLLTHITALGVVTTCGAPRWYSHLVGHPGKRTLMRGMRGLFARRCKTMFAAHYLMDVSTPESRAAFLDRVRSKMQAF